jgi:hypothetical protein
VFCILAGSVDLQPVRLPEPPYNFGINKVLDSLTQETVTGYMNELVGFNTRYTFAPNFPNVQAYVNSKFQDFGLDLKPQTYDILPISCAAYYAIKEDTELTNGSKLFKKVGTDYELYLPRIGYHCEYSEDGSILKICGSYRMAWNINPNDYHDWRFSSGWFQDSPPDTLYNIYDIYKDGNQVWACGSEGLYYYGQHLYSGMIIYSADDGNTWQKTVFPTSPFYSIGKYKTGINGIERFFCAGGAGRVYYSDDGFNWDFFSDVMPIGINVRDICGYLDSPIDGSLPHYDVMFVGELGLIMITPDGGLTWNQYGNIPVAEWTKCGHADGRSWVVGTILGGEPGLAVSDDSGVTWFLKPVPFSVSWGLSNLWLNPANKDEAWICGKYAAHTIDGGNNWEFLPNPSYGSNTAINLVGELRGVKKPNEVVIVCAHLDSISEDPLYDAPGADDDASGAAAVLACAEIMSRYSFEKTVRFVLFSGNEMSGSEPMPGSRAYAQFLADEGKQVSAIINLDTIGFSDDGINDICISPYPVTELVNFITACRDTYVRQLIIGPEYDSRNEDNIDVLPPGSNYVWVREFNPTIYNPYIEFKTDTLEQINPTQVYLTTRLILATSMESAVFIGGRNMQQGTPYVYPNPLKVSQGQHILTFMGCELGATISVYDLSGFRVWHTIATGAEMQWEPNLASGMYLFVLKTDYGSYTGKFAVIK